MLCSDCSISVLFHIFWQGEEFVKLPPGSSHISNLYFHCMFTGAGASLKGLRFRGMWREGDFFLQSRFSCFTSYNFLSTFTFSPLLPHLLHRPCISSSSSSGHLLHLEISLEMPGPLPKFPSMPRGVTMPALLNSLPRGINPPSLPRGITMPSLSSLPSMPQGVTIPSLPRGMSLPRTVAMPTVPQAPRRLLQDCCSVLDHQTPGGNH